MCSIGVMCSLTLDADIAHHKTGQALDHYLRARARRDDASEPWLWLGKRGRLTETGVELAVKRRGLSPGERL